MPDETIGENSEALNGAFSDQGFLRMPLRNIASPDEATRRADTDSYLASARTTLTLTGAGATLGSLSTLQLFKNRYGLGTASDTIATYYNKGDLGLGRDMHCRDQLSAKGEIACYVTNYASGDDGSEFTFGYSADIAFANIANKHPVATVAMVYRDPAKLAAGRDPVLFVVYDGAENLLDTAPLDRHGIGFFGAYNAAPGANPVGFGTPGTNFNNHYPSNCLNCHGGVYSGGGVAGAAFLPFDLDQFQFPFLAAPTQAQQDAFRNLNQMVRKVAAGQGVTPLVTQIDGWYDNSSPLAGNFDSSYVPVAWRNDQPHGNESVYFNVIRRSCRGCHVTNAHTFDTPTAFLGEALLGDDLLSNKMPHALQTQREFWLSNQPAILEDYLRTNGNSVAADKLHSAGPGLIVTLDPPQLVSSLLW